MSRYDRYRNRHDGYHHSRRRWRYRQRSSFTGTLIKVLIVILVVRTLGEVFGTGNHAGARLSMTNPPPPSQVQSTPDWASPPTPNALTEAQPERADLQGERGAEWVSAPVAPAREAVAGSPPSCMNSECQLEYAAYGAAPGGKAFAVSPSGQGFWAAGEESVSVAAAKASQGCQEATGQPCEVVAVAGADS